MLAGRKMTEIGRELGVSKQRIGQIVRKAGVVAPTGNEGIAAARAQVEDLVKAGMSDALIAKTLMASVTMVAGERCRLGLSEGYRRETLRPIILQHLANGFSFRRIDQMLGMNRGQSKTMVKDAGVSSRCSKFRDFSHRRAIALKLRSEGATWQAVAAAFAEHEGFQITSTGAHFWCWKHHPDLFASKSSKGSAR
ncbi:hypothetical protein MBTS_10915 [Methylobacterium bullatum]|nr:hypothetical protein [Methylobacterium bullatum]